MAAKQSLDVIGKEGEKQISSLNLSFKPFNNLKLRKAVETFGALVVSAARCVFFSHKSNKDRKQKEMKGSKGVLLEFYTGRRFLVFRRRLF